MFFLFDDLLVKNLQGKVAMFPFVPLSSFGCATKVVRPTANLTKLVGCLIFRVS